MLPLNRSGLEVGSECDGIIPDLSDSNIGYHLADFFDTSKTRPTCTAGGHLLERIHRGWQLEETDDQRDH